MPISKFRYSTGVFIRGVSAIIALLGLFGLILNWLGFFLSFDSKDHSGWLIMGSAERFFGLENCLKSIYAIAAGMLGIAIGEDLEGKSNIFRPAGYEKSFNAFKNLKILSILLGISCIAYAVTIIFHNSLVLWNIKQAWMLLSLWPRNLIRIIDHPHILIKLNALGYFYLISYISSLVFSVILAKKTGRNRFLSLIFTFLFPYLLILLAFNNKFLKTKHKIPFIKK